MGRFLITGCSGGGKSSLLAELERRGFETVPEPGRRIVEGETDPASPRLPWNDAAGFAQAALALAADDFDAAADRPGPVLFDRGLLDALVALAHATEQPLDPVRATARRYDRPVFLAPPWAEIFRTDPHRRHDFAAARAEHDRIAWTLTLLGWPVVTLPRQSVEARADLVIRSISEARFG